MAELKTERERGENVPANTGHQSNTKPSVKRPVAVTTNAEDRGATTGTADSSQTC